MLMGFHATGRSFHQTLSGNAITVADDSTVQLTSTYCGVGLDLIWENYRGYNGYSFIGYNGASGSAGNYGSFAHADTDTKHCVYSTGAHASFYKNRTGGARNVEIIIYGSRFGG